MSTSEEKGTLERQLSPQNEEISNPLGNLEPKQQRFIHLYLTGQYSINKLAQLLEVHPNTLHNWLRKEEVRNAIDEMQDVTHQIVSQEMKSMTMKAITRMRELMDSPIDGVALQAVKDILDRTGHKPKQKTEKTINVHTFEEKLSDIIEATINDELEEADWEEIDEG